MPTIASVEFHDRGVEPGVHMSPTSIQQQHTTTTTTSNLVLALSAAAHAGCADNDWLAASADLHVVCLRV